MVSSLCQQAAVMILFVLIVAGIVGSEVSGALVVLVVCVRTVERGGEALLSGLNRIVGDCRGGGSDYRASRKSCINSASIFWRSCSQLCLCGCASGLKYCSATFFVFFAV